MCICVSQNWEFFYHNFNLFFLIVTTNRKVFRNMEICVWSDLFIFIVAAPEKITSSEHVILLQQLPVIVHFNYFWNFRVFSG
jgi:hypothetical protein